MRVLNDDIQFERTLVFPPSYRTTYFRIPSFVTAQSLTAYGVRTAEVIAGSTAQFLLTCHYGSCTSDGFNRLVDAPVYNMKDYFVGTTLWAVIDNYLNHVNIGMRELGTEMKVILPAKQFLLC